MNGGIFATSRTLCYLVGMAVALLSQHAAISAVEIHRAAGRAGLWVCRSGAVACADSQFRAAFGSAGADRAGAGGRAVSRPRHRQRQGDSAQSRLGLAVLGRAAVRSGRHLVHSAGVLVEPHQSHASQLDGDRVAGAGDLSDCRSARAGDAAARRLVDRLLAVRRRRPVACAEPIAR